MSTNVTIIKFGQFETYSSKLQTMSPITVLWWLHYGIYGTMCFLTYFKYSPHNCHSIVITFEGGVGVFAAVHNGKNPT